MTDPKVTDKVEGPDPSNLASPSVERLDAFIGEWSMEAQFPDSPSSGPIGRTAFEWLPGRRFVLQRWEVPNPAAPDGVAIIGPAEGRDGYFQHYYDSRGVARSYWMTFDDGVWRLLRGTPDFSPLDFSQRFAARFSADGGTIRGSWEKSTDATNWVHDFELIYTRLQ
jgi:hypothetical protein